MAVDYVARLKRRCERELIQLNIPPCSVNKARERKFGGLARLILSPSQVKSHVKSPQRTVLKKASKTADLVGRRLGAVGLFIASQVASTTLLGRQLCEDDVEDLQPWWAEKRIEQQLILTVDRLQQQHGLRYALPLGDNITGLRYNGLSNLYKS